MIKVGQQKKARYWGKYTVKSVVQLKRPVAYHSKEVGTVLFKPTLVQIEWETPYADRLEFWFPYWITIGGREKYGQFAPMMGEGSILELLKEAISQGLFSSGFLRSLNRKITEKLTAK